MSFRKLVWFWLALAASTSTALGDAIVVSQAMKASTIAEYFVDQDGVRLKMEIGPADLDAFRNLLPDSTYQKLGHEPRPLGERILEFFQRDWVIRADNGEPLLGRVVLIDSRRRLRRDDITGEPLAIQPKDAERVLYLELAYSWKDRPQSISLQPPLGKEGRVPTANVGFVLYHDGVAVNDFRYLSAVATVDLDWSDPWYSRFRHRNLKRQFDAPLSVFLYVDFFELRKEIVVRPKDLQQWVDLGLEGQQTIAVEQQEELKQRVADFLSRRSPVTIDGRPVQGTLDRIHFIRRTLRTTGVVDPPEPLDVNVATLGVIFVYPLNGLPQQASVAWDLFGDKMQSIPAVATDQAGGLPSELTPDDPLLVWTNFLKNPTRPAMMTVARPESRRISVPVASGVCIVVVLALLTTRLFRKKARRSALAWTAMTAAMVLAIVALPFFRMSVVDPFSAAPAVEPRQAEQLLHALLYNIYRSFDHRDESLVYDRLALSISGELLSEVYLQVRRGMELANQGGASVKIDDVEMLEVVQQPSADAAGLTFRCRWNASGSVGHWGHIHRRTNQYDAVVTVTPMDGTWKISNIDLQDERRVGMGENQIGEGPSPGTPR